ncbi:11180_t:CDS:2 [Ambispora leptoticha]|uniref:Glutathione peroxidase n=1 Tax=Ambispora leptoticha TaxID=144679 RepID=A0A9N9FSP8_9GLOM|nr:11180_t:CDS:2 [Ambispora leptoticha]
MPQSDATIIVTSFYDLEALDKNQQVFKFSELKGKVALIVNTASKCGFTPQFAGLEKLYQKYKNDGLVIMGFPSGQFNQELNNQEAISEFCQVNYGVTFPIMAKVEVNGDNASPVYNYLKSQKAGLFGLRRIKWNFEKFLIDRNGKVVQRYGTRRFTIQDTEKITWSEFEKRTRDLFKLPSWTPFTLSYTDEEGDNITLSTDFELEQINNAVSSVSNTSLISDTFGIDEIPSFARNKNGVSSFTRNKKKDIVVFDKEEEGDEFVNIEPTFHPTIYTTPIDTEQKEKEPIKELISKNNAIIEEESNMEKRSKDNDKFEQLSPLPSHDQQTSLAEEFQTDQRQQVPILTQQFNRTWMQYRSPRGNSNYCGRPQAGSILSSRWRNHNADNDKGSGSGSGGAKQAYGLSPNEMNSKLEALHAMGFGNDLQNKELLYMYNGNVESVVEEILVKSKRTEQYK